MANSSILNGFRRTSDLNGNNPALYVFGISKMGKAPTASHAARTNSNAGYNPFQDIPFKEKVKQSFKARRNDIHKVISENRLAGTKINNARLVLPYPKPILKSTAHFRSPISCGSVRSEVV